MEQFAKAHTLARVEHQAGSLPFMSWLLAVGVHPVLACQPTGHDACTKLRHYARFIPEADEGVSIERAFRGTKGGTK